MSTLSIAEAAAETRNHSAGPSLTNPAVEMHDSSSVWIARVLVLAVTAGLAWYTWGHWGDFQVDCGREIYVPVAILQGKLLFRDIWYMYGPLAPYVKALLFWIFGVHLTVLYLFGLTLTAGFALMTFEVARQIRLPLAACVLPSLFFLSEAFYPFIRNFVFPYSYAASLAAFLGITCLYFVLRHGATRSSSHLAIAAILTGLVVLTKQEFGIACLVLLFFEVLAHFFDGRSRSKLLRETGLCLLGLSPALLGYGWFLSKVSLRALLFENWITTPGTYFMRTFGAHVTADQGFRLPPSELLEVAEYMALAFCMWYLFASLNAVLIRKFDLKSPKAIAATVFLSLLPVTIALVILAKSFPWGLRVDATSSMRFAYMGVTQTVFPSGCYFVAIFFLLFVLRRSWRAPHSVLYAQQALLGVYAALVGLRQMMEMKPTLFMCSVFFNVPAFLVLVIVLKNGIDLAVRGLDTRRRQLLAASLLSIEALWLLILFVPKSQRLPAPLTTDHGTLYTRADVAVLVPQIIAFMKSHTKNGKDILVLPEPPSLYTFAGMEAPSRWYSVMPGYIPPAQEPQFIEEVKAKEVNFILIADRTMEESGGVRFGDGYNEGIYRWILANYTKIGQFGPLKNKVPGDYVVCIFQKKSAAEWTP